MLLIYVHFAFSSRRIITKIMKMPRSLFRSAVIALCLSVLVAPRLLAAETDEEPTVVASADCYAIGQHVAAQYGGTLAKANAATQGGQAVCVIVVLVPGREGERPRRSEFVVPQN